MLRCVAVVRTDNSEELVASIIRVTRIGEQGTLAVTSNQRTLRRNIFLPSVRLLLVVREVGTGLICLSFESIACTYDYV
jgi:hypothetical protein